MFVHSAHKCWTHTCCGVARIHRPASAPFLGVLVARRLCTHHENGLQQGCEQRFLLSHFVLAQNLYAVIGVVLLTDGIAMCPVDIVVDVDMAAPTHL